MARLGMLVNISRCLGCSSCVVGCKNWHALPSDSPGRIRLIDWTTGRYPQINRWMLPVSCMHCDHPPCVAVCRFKACHKGEDGVVTINPKRCTACELCILACPYGARYLRPDTRKVDGCDFCQDRVREGKKPLCVEACTGQALVFGDLDDPDSELSRLIKQTRARRILSHYRTGPNIYYTGPLPVQNINTIVARSA